MQKSTGSTNTAQLLNGPGGLYTTQGLGRRRRKGKMPYKVFKQGNNFEVKKLDADGKPTGKALGTHPTMAKAQAQMRALYASEKGAAKKEVEVIEAVEEKAMSDEMPMPKMPMMKDDYGEMDEGPMQMPMPMMPMATSFADLMAQRDADEMAQVVGGLTDDFATLACNISCDPTITDKAAALAKLAQEFQDLVQEYAKHEDTEETVGGELEEHLYDADDASEYPTGYEDKELAAVQQIIGDNQPSRDKATITNQGALPDSAFLYIESGGKKDDSGKTTPRSLRHLPVPDAAHIRNAISRLSQPATGKGAESWLTESLRKTLLAKARKMLESANKKELDDTQLYIWKEDGQYRWLSAYSNNRLDDESEIISSQSHKEFDQALHNKEWEMPELYLWHIPYSVGQADYHAYDESAGFPVAAGHFHPGMDWAAEGILKEGWNGASHGMPEQWIKRDSTNDKVIIRHRTREITFLPLWAAANKLAFSIISKEQNMEVQKGLPAHKRPEFVKAFGEERVKQIEAALAEKSKDADEAGVAKKALRQAQDELDTQPPTLTKEDFMKGLDTVLDKVKEALDAFDARLKTMEAAQVKEQDQFDVMALLKAKSIIGKEAARVDGRSMLAKDAPEEAPAQATGVHPVGLINNLLAANEAYYRGGR